VESSFHQKKGRYEIESHHYELNAHQWLCAISGTFATAGSYYCMICFPLNTWEEGVRLSFRVTIRVTVCVRESVSVRVRVRVRVRDRVPVRVRVRIMQPLSLVFPLFGVGETTRKGIHQASLYAWIGIPSRWSSILYVS
jgi:hypothetical protein